MIAGLSRFPALKAHHARQTFAMLRSMSDSLPVIQKAYTAYKQTADINAKLPKTHRYSLGASLEQSVLTLLEHLIMAKNAPKPHKAGFLIKAGACQEVATLKLRLFLELKLANETKVFQLQKTLEDIGRMSGGWRKSLGA